MEGAHGELGARLADGLCGHGADRLTEVDHLLGREIHAVAGLAHTVARFAGHRRTRNDRGDGRSIKGLGVSRREVVTFLEEHGAVVISNAFRKHAAAQCFCIINLDTGSAHAINLHAARRTAILLGHDGVLRDVKEAAREIAGLRGAKRGVGETLPRPVRGHEVFNRVQPFYH